MMKRKISRILIVLLSLLLLWMPSAAILSGFLVTDRPLEKADAILVLSGSAAYRERTSEAARLYHSGVAPMILLTDDGRRGGWNNALERNPYFVERAKWNLEESGVPGEAIKVLPLAEGDGTDYEAELAAVTVPQLGIKSIFIVTSAYHSRRSLWTFETVFKKHGLDVRLGVTSPPVVGYEPPSFFWWTSRNGARIVATEYLKLAYYFFKI